VRDEKLQSFDCGFNPGATDFTRRSDDADEDMVHKRQEPKE